MGEIGDPRPGDGRPGRLWRTPEGAYVAEGAVVVGDVRLGPEASVWFACVLRGDDEPITIGARSNVQDGTIVHVDRGFPVVVGEEVTIGHRAVVHGCTVGDRALIGMGAILLSGARIGEEAIVGAGALVAEGTEVPPRTLVLGVPARVRRELTREEVAGLPRGARHYVELARSCS